MTAIIIQFEFLCKLYITVTSSRESKVSLYSITANEINTNKDISMITKNTNTQKHNQVFVAKLEAKKKTQGKPHHMNTFSTGATRGLIVGGAVDSAG